MFRALDADRGRCVLVHASGSSVCDSEWTMAAGTPSSDENSQPMVLCDCDCDCDDVNCERAAVAGSVDDLRDWHCGQRHSEAQRQWQQQHGGT